MRKLATVRRVSELYPIKDKDRIELAIIDGWSVIIKKGEIPKGELCVYVEIDSVLPPTPDFEFLASKNYRIKTMKMAGVVSQGICFPLSFLPKGNYKEGDDVTEIMGIKQYEATMDIEPKEEVKHSWIHKKLMRVSLYREIYYKISNLYKERNGFPPYLKRTDEERIQNLPHLLLDKETKWVVSEKIDGQSGSFVLERKKFLFWETYDYIVCSRNRRINPHKEKNSSYWSVSERYNIEKALKGFMSENRWLEWVAIQGECTSPKVQKNKYKVTAPDLFVFNVISPEGRLGTMEAKKLCSHLELKFVPIVKEEYILPDTMEEIVNFSNGQSMIGDNLREGLVIRSQDGKQSFKVVSPQFLLKYDE